MPNKNVSFIFIMASQKRRARDISVLCEEVLVVVVVVVVVMVSVDESPTDVVSAVS